MSFFFLLVFWLFGEGELMVGGGRLLAKINE